MKKKIYISSSEKDLNFAKDIYDYLNAINEFESFCNGNVQAGEDIEKIRSERLEDSDIVLLLISSNYLNDCSNSNVLNHAITLKKQSKILLVLVKIKPFPLDGYPQLANQIVFPVGNKTIIDYKRRDEAYNELAEYLLKWYENYSDQFKLGKQLNKYIGQKEMLSLVIEYFEGQYQNFSELKRSAYYSTYCAEEIYLPRKVVIKIFHNWAIIDDEKLINELKDFYDRIKHISTFKHRNIKTLYAAKLEKAIKSNIKYIVQEYIEGDSLNYIVHLTGRIPIVEVIRVLKKIGSALAYGHNKGLVHRYVNLENILFDEELEPVLSPFKMVNPQEHAVDILNLENYKYHSPEQIDNHETSPYSDQYAFGAVLFEMITGESLFDGGITEIVLQRKLIYNNSELIKTRLLKWNCPEELTSLILRMLAKSPSDRFESMDDILEEVKLIELNYKNEKVSTVIQSYYRCCFRNKNFLKEFYEKFFERNTKAEKFFPHPKNDWSVHFKKLRYTLNVILTIDYLAETNYLHKVKNIHKEKDIDEKLYWDFCESLLELVRVNDKKEWEKDPKIKESWTHLLKNSVNYMMTNTTSVMHL